MFITEKTNALKWMSVVISGNIMIIHPYLFDNHLIRGDIVGYYKSLVMLWDILGYYRI